MNWHFAFFFHGLCHISRSAPCADGENRHARGYEPRARQSSDELAPFKRNRRKNTVLNFLSLFLDVHRKMLACIDLACCSPPQRRFLVAVPFLPTLARCLHGANSTKIRENEACLGADSTAILEFLGADRTESLKFEHF